MSNLPIYEMLAQAFAGEGVDACFNLMGDGNMHWAAMSKIDGVRMFHARHEHCACGMAMSTATRPARSASHRSPADPGVTQIMTGSPTAVRARVPLVVFAGESPITRPSGTTSISTRRRWSPPRARTTLRAHSAQAA